ncbi:MAG: 4-hydroxy-3-methylbut-2-enyl diphosphate reductase [Bacteroidales bacterium]
MKVEINESSGFCFGVINAIKTAETKLNEHGKIYCLGDIVHNSEEIERLKKLGLKAISHDEYYGLKNCTVMLRAHGEPPEVYDYAKANNIQLFDATCPVVLSLQKRIKKGYNIMEGDEGQVVIYGKQGHAEVVGLNGQIGNKAIIIQEQKDLELINFSKPVQLFSQTTQPIDGFNDLAKEIERKGKSSVKINDTICRQVANRVPKLKDFARNYDVIIFMSGKKSSNGKFLYEVCRQENPNTYFVSAIDEIDDAWFEGVVSVGICGATSTPQWLMEDAKLYIERRNS